LLSIGADPSPTPFPSPSHHRHCHCHHTQALLASKEPDLPGPCRQWDVFGMCSNGFHCRFAGNHIQILPPPPAAPAAGAACEGAVPGTAPSVPQAVNMRRPEGRGGVLSRDDCTWNSLQKDVQSLLRKKKYNYHGMCVYVYVYMLYVCMCVILQLY